VHEPAPTVAAPLQVAAPSPTVMLPLGVPAPGATIANVQFTVYGWPTTDGSGASLVIASVVAALFTSCDSVSELPLKLASPP